MRFFTMARTKANAGVIVGALACVMLVAGAPLVSAQSLTDALINAYKNSPQLKSGRAGLRGTDEGVAQARSALRPSLSATTSLRTARYIGLERTTYSASLALNLNLTLWDGGASKLAIEVARQNVSVSRRTLVETEQTVLLAAVTAFMDMRRDAKNLALAQNNQAVLASQVKATKDRFEVGEVRRTDVSQAESSLALAQSNVAFRQGSLEISREAFHVATGKYPGVLKNPPPLPRIPATQAAAKSVALRSHPSLARAKDLAKIAELNVYRAEAAMKPKFSLTGNVGINDNSINGDTVSLGLQGSVPIYRGGALTAAYRQAVALREKSRFDVERTAQLVAQNVNRFWMQLEIARATITARQKQVRASRVALRGVREEAKLGARTTLDVLDAERVLVQAQTDLSIAKRDEYVAVYSLLSAMGLLTAKHLGLGLKTYDPNHNFNKVAKAPGPSNRAKLLEKILTRAGKK